MNDTIAPKSMVKVIGSVIGGIFALILLFNIIGFNKTGEYTVVQDVFGGMHVKLTPGPFMKLWGHTDIYRQVITISFGDAPGHKSFETNDVPVIFNDGTKATIKATMRISLPANAKQILEIRNQFAGGYDHFVSNGAVPVGANAIKLSANLRSSREAYTTLAVLQSDVEDQLMYGTYMTRSVEKRIYRSTGDSETVRMTEIVTDSVGKPIRKPTILEDLGCRITQCQIEVPTFDEAVNNMIKMQRDQTLKTEVSKQNAIRAAQDAITSEANGKAEVMRVKYEREVEKQKAVTDAERDTIVAALQKRTAEYQKQTLILQGQGEAEKRKLIMVADGALDKKLEAYKAVQQMWATAFQGYQGQVVPTTVMGGGMGNGSNAATSFMDIITAKAARDLSVDVGARK